MQRKWAKTTHEQAIMYTKRGFSIHDTFYAYNRLFSQL